VTYDYDVYFAHSWEDKPTLQPVVAALRSDGLRVWYDDSELESGTSLRQQLDRGMLRSRLGVVVLSKSFFGERKVWAPAEFDVWFERSSGSRIITVWLDVEKDDVAAWSPIASTLFARRHASPDFIGQLLGDVRKKSIDAGIYAAFLRNAVEKNMEWLRPPQFFHESLDAIDTDNRWTHPDTPIPRDDARNVEMAEVFRDTQDLAGQLIIVVGRPHFPQVLDRQGAVQQFALQLSTAEPGFERCIVQGVACKVTAHHIDPPDPPGDPHLVLAWGWVVGRGDMRYGVESWQTVVMFCGGFLFMDLADPTTAAFWP